MARDGLLLVLALCASSWAANTEFAQVPQTVFPGRAPVNRALSLQQQTQILRDIQHRFTPLQLPASTQQGPLLYSHQASFPAGPPAPAPPPPPQQPPASSAATPPQSRPAGSTSAQPQQLFVPSSGLPLQFYSTLTQGQPIGATLTQQYNNYVVEAAPNTAARVVPTDPASHTQLSDGEGSGGQLLLQNGRQQLYQQIRDYSDSRNVQRISEARPSGVEGLLQPQASSFRPTPQPTQSSSFIPTLTSAQRDESRKQPLQVLLQEQPARSQIPQTTAAPRSQPKNQLSPSTAPAQQKKTVEQLQSQFQTQLQQRQDLIRKLKLAIANSEVPITADKSQVEPKPGAPGTPPPVIYLANGNKLQLVSSPEEAALLQSGIKPTTPTPITTPPAPTLSFEELTKDVLPPGAQFEVIRHKQDGGLEEVGKLPPTLPQKKVTFVFLEEQPDGTLKVQGVKGNTGTAHADGQTSPPDVDQIIKKLQQGELRLPSSNKLPEAPQFIPSPGTTPQESSISATFVPRKPPTPVTQTNTPNNLISQSEEEATKYSPTVTTANQLSYQYFNIQPSQGSQVFPSISFSQSIDSQASPSAYPEIQSAGQFESTSTNPTPVVPDTNSQYSGVIQTTDNNGESVFVSASSSQTVPPIRNQFDFDSKRQKSPRIRFSSGSSSTTVAPITTSTRPLVSYRRTSSAPPRLAAASNINARKESTTVHRTRYRSTTSSPTIASSYTPQNSPTFDDHTVSFLNQVNGQETVQKQAIKSHQAPTASRNVSKSLYESANFLRNVAEATSQDTVYQQVTGNQNLSVILRNSGLYAMARFLKESSLDKILNDTGPYTLFAPTDKAFEALLVQLGGPDRAGEKFKENPRLLSGLLLHHVVPGAFPLESLQDEMTGVSLAGTQLRVNTYTTQDEQWNDVKVTTINGARVLSALHDVAVPQGVLHAVDRVMFPLPVGDALQTLLADRERRFESFLRAVRTSGLSAVLSGSKTHTVFAPTERAFSRLPAAKRARLLSDPESARALVSRHVVRGALYSAGLRYYQLRDALAADSALTLTVNAAGQLKVNSVLVVTQNIPTTNGVIHAIDSLL